MKDCKLYLKIAQILVGYHKTDESQFQNKVYYYYYTVKSEFLDLRKRFDKDL